MPVFIGNLNYRMTMPAAVVQARNVQEVQEIVAIARQSGTRLTVKNGGHSYMGYCLNEGGIVLDMSLMNDCSIDTAAMAVTIQGGAIWKTVYKALLAENDQYIIIGGQCPYVGASGFTLGGGLSPFSRSYGLGCDNLVSMTVVTADSEVVTVSRDDEDEKRRDLFWALTGGGGGNFGVTVGMTCKIHKLSDEDGNVVCGDLTWKLPQQQELFQAAMDAFNSKECPNELTVDALWTHGKRKQFTGGMTVIYNGGMAKAREVLAPYLELKPSKISLEEMKWIDWVEHSEGWDTRSQVYHHHASFIFAEGAITREVTTKIYNLVTDAAELLGVTGGNEKDTPKCHVLWDHIGGETARVAPGDTAFFWRGGHYVSTIKLQWTDAGKRDEVMGFIARCKAELLPHAIQQKAAYLNYIDGTVLGWQEAYYGDNYPRLQRVKTAWDPANFFWNMQSVRPLDVGTGGGTRVIHEELPVPTPEEILASAGVQQVRKWWNAYAPRVTPESLGTLDSVDQAIDKDCEIRKCILEGDVSKAQAAQRAKMSSQIGSGRG